VSTGEQTPAAAGDEEAGPAGAPPAEPGAARPGAGRSGTARAALLVVLVAALVLVADQLSKALVRDSIRLGGERKLFPGLALVHTTNQGVAFGLNPGGGAGVAILIGLALLVLLFYFARHAQRPWLWLPTGMLLGGAIGNAIDRLRLGAVTDFVKLPLGWPPFNVADIAITVGVLLLVGLIGFDEPRRRARHVESARHAATHGGRGRA
jgi:signal peptidase II